ncbi:hypothetical protein A2866_04205 [Candidatus Roizmanbacteria bacterium RIFCSPHIGHO2_01_FULL_39_8]|uniref:Four helix bundle protein n=3 Tax=Candidatus Roizmaniibacteriota TaxID=1752723 RepID=A0A1F7GSM1_9BACT|nr:MAG: hypothetical protein A2866_04205 [Candidatus Roizmanbacteria bacterium RIFCSPHIGHO2_01_FULL_39_8]OGK27901.1 MAG: hypothetical protein A3C28_04395 [Candidatus Roizmanbacteria bacterium RIFCSPHIGHO2_02_FULL_39_9]OGK36666.1 MAG: hypothetical protein A3F60_03570 [Candidatus Roizmanbacteria bacterium RIFCSPHIGHO2_12_FULL_39_8]
MKFNSFEEIHCWQKSRGIALIINKEFKYCKDFSFKDQIHRASVSIMNNIAEGFERKGNKEFKKFLYIAKGSCAEVRSMIYLAKDLNYINERVYQDILNRSIVISKMLSGLIKTI